MIEHSLASQVEQLADDWALTVCSGVGADIPLVIGAIGVSAIEGRCHRGIGNRTRNSPGQG